MGNYAIPERLEYYIRPPIKTKKTTGETDEEIEVRKVYVIDENSKSKESAKNWACGHRRYDYEKRKYVYENNKYDLVSRPNDPFYEIELYNLEYRSEGGAVFKVRTPEGYAFDLRLPEVMDIILRCDVDKGGHFVGEFMWVRLGSAYRLTHKGSKTYKQAVKDMKDRAERKKIEDNRKRIPAKEIVVGGIYKKKNGQVYIHGGRAGKAWVELETHYYGYDKDHKYHSGQITNEKTLVEFREFRTGQVPDIRYGRNSACSACLYHNQRSANNAYEKIGEISEEDVLELINYDPPRPSGYNWRNTYYYQNY